MIGIFDSGSGGLTVLKAIRNVLPSANVLYFGDIKNVPYGSKTREELSVLTVDAIKQLSDRGVSTIVSACNSVSASLAISLFDIFDIKPTQLIEMVGPTVAWFKDSNARILLCATPATIDSHIYQSAFHMIGKTIDTLAISELASAIEFGATHEEVEEIIRNAFANTDWNKFDVLVLACTHYPLVENIFRHVVPAPLALFDPAIAVAERVVKLCWPQEVADSKTEFLISKDSKQFRALVSQLFPGQQYSIEVVD